MTSSKLKVIAVSSMIFFHVGNVFGSSNYWITRLLANMGIPWYIGSIFSFDYIGRISFPIFAYLIAESYLYTKDIKYFISRLLIFGIISQIPFKFALHYDNINGILSVFTGSVNIFFTLALGVLAVYEYEKMREKEEHIIACFCPVLACCIIVGIFNTDYNVTGVILIFVCYIIKSKKTKIIVVGMWIFVQYFIILQWHGSWLYWVKALQEGYIDSFFTELVGVIMPMSIVVWLLLYYNGKRGLKFKYLFYTIYPVHLVILSIGRYYIT